MREAELRELRARERDQSKALQASVQQATRAKAKLRRLATQADAASSIAEVEVALDRLRAAPGSDARAASIAVPQRIIESAATPFTQGDYDTAMDRAAQAEQLVAMLQQPHASAKTATRGPEVPFDLGVALRVIEDSNLRRQPRRTAPVHAVLPRGTMVIARGYRGSWLRVDAGNGETGWVHRSLVDAP